MKILKTILALALVIIVISMILVIYLAKFADQTIAGKLLKNKIISNYSLVPLLKLDQPGDYRYRYLDPEKDIAVAVYYVPGLAPDEEVANWVEKMIKETTGKNATVNVNSYVHIPNLKSYTDNELNKIRKEIGRSGRPDLHIVYLSTYDKVPGYVGLTVNKDTIFLFKATMYDLNNNKEVVKLIERSTIMHEWGHLLGMEHVDDPDCIMSEAVEVYENRRFQETNIPTSYCSEELFELDLMRRKFNLR
jgi:hypothetical protein